MARAAQLYRTMRQDGVLGGLLGTRTSGLVRLPKRFTGHPEIVQVLEGRDGARSVFDDMFPPSELALLAADGIVLGVGIAELVDVEGRDFPVMVRLDPEWLQYRWNENRWYFNSIAGQLPITPGDGRWILHTPGGRLMPWQGGQWQALGRSWINKTHALLHRSNYEAKLANPARAAVAPIGASEAQRLGFLQNLIAWGINTVFELPVGWDVKLIESNGRGFEVFQATIDTSDKEMMIVLSGQVVTVTGGTGFANADVHKSIRADLIQQTGDDLAYTINTQGIPSFVLKRWDVDALNQSPCVVWVTAPPKDIKAEADGIESLGKALAALQPALSAFGREIDIDELLSRFDIPVLVDAATGDPTTGAVDETLLENLVNPPKGNAAPAPEQASRRRITKTEFEDLMARKAA